MPLLWIALVVVLIAFVGPRVEAWVENRRVRRILARLAYLDTRAHTGLTDKEVIELEMLIDEIAHLARRG